MRPKSPLASVVLPAIFLVVFAAGPTAAAAEEDVAPAGIWTAPPYWTPPGASREAPARGRTPEAGRQALTGGPVPLPFVAITPCRQYDSRSGAVLSDNTPRTVTLIGAPCGIPSDAQGAAVNITVFDIVSNMGNAVLKVGTASPPTTAWINYGPAETQRGNAGVLPLGAGGTIVVQVNQGAGSVDFVVDVFGYYSPLGVVNNVNTLTGAVTLAQGSNVTITPSGNTLTIAATGGPGGSLPAGTSGQTLYNTGSAWAASSALTNDGTNVALTGTLLMPDPLSVKGGGGPFLSAGSSSGNTFLGLGSGGATTTGTFNTFLGNNAGTTTATTCCSVGIGNNALTSKTDGDYDVAVGNGSMALGAGIPSGGHNVAVGHRAYGSGPSGSFNTALGAAALTSLTAGDNNTACGHGALAGLTSGSNNTVLGNFAGNALTSGSGNLYLASGSLATESNVTRIGGTQTVAYIAGVRGVTTGFANAIPVLIDSTGQLGTGSSSASVKDDIRDMGDESAKLMRLRPVTFRYKAHGPDGPKQYGLIAEEVDAVLPELVARSKDGRIETVMYHELPAMLLNELQKALRRIESLEREVAALSEARSDPR